MWLAIGVRWTIMEGEISVSVWTIELPLVEVIESSCLLDRRLLIGGVYPQRKLGFWQEYAILGSHIFLICTSDWIIGIV